MLDAKQLQSENDNLREQNATASKVSGRCESRGQICPVEYVNLRVFYVVYNFSDI